MDASAATDGRREVVVSAQGLARTLHDGSIALVLLNRLDHGSSTLSVSWAELGLQLTVACGVRDLLGRKDLPGKTSGNLSATVAAHSAAFVRISCV